MEQRMHTEKQCLQKLQGIKQLSEQIILKHPTDYETRGVAESIITMCNELSREFPDEKAGT